MFPLGNHGHVSVCIDAVRTIIGTWREIPFIYGIPSWNRLRIWFISSLLVSKAPFKKAWKIDRTNLGTITASRAFVKVYMSSKFIQGYLKVAFFPGDFFNFR
jgi:hypothetical protein